ncbi:MAG: hypothetical protein ACI9XR_000496 [Flavobacterium sp.]|jgi:hypothetical protein
MQGKITHLSDFFLQLNRNGYLEDCYFNFSYSPIKQEDFNIGGLLVTMVETTKRNVTTNCNVFSSRR